MLGFDLFGLLCVVCKVVCEWRLFDLVSVYVL